MPMVSGEMKLILKLVDARVDAQRGTYDDGSPSMGYRQGFAAGIYLYQTVLQDTVSELEKEEAEGL